MTVVMAVVKVSVWGRWDTRDNGDRIKRVTVVKVMAVVCVFRGWTLLTV